MEATNGSWGSSLLVASQATSAVGDGSFYVTSALFLTHVAGLPLALTGVFLSVAWAAGFVVGAPVGRLADDFGLRRTAVGLAVVVAGMLLAVSLVSGPIAYLAVLVGYAVAQSGLVAVRQALVVVAVPVDERVGLRARLQVVSNAGIGAGAVLGGVALSIGTATAFRGVLVLDAVGFLAAAVLTSRLHVGDRPPPAPAAAPTAGGVVADRPYLLVAALASVLYLYMPMLSVVLPLYLARRTEAPTWLVAAVFVVNTGGVMLLQLRAASRVVDLPSATRSTRRGGLLLAGSCLVIGAAALPSSWPVAALLVLGFAVVQVLGEVRLGAGAWHLGFTLADADRPGEWQGLFTSGLPLARSVGPVLLTGLVLAWSGPGWLVLAAVFALAGLALGPAAAWAARTRRPVLSDTLVGATR